MATLVSVTEFRNRQGRNRVPVLDRAASKFEVADDGCWVWTAGTDRGYGMLWDGSVYRKAHRVVYEAVELDHICNDRRCINPDHLEPVTHQENMQRAESRREFCKNGHAHTPENRYVYTRNGRRSTNCKPCAINRAAKRREEVQHGDPGQRC